MPRRLTAPLPLIPTFLAAACLGACAPDAPSERPGSHDAPIVGGILDNDGAAHEEVVLLSLPFGGTCTGTLVADNLVLTAWHCVATSTAPGIGCDIFGNSSNGNHVGADFPPAQIGVFTGAAPNTSGTPLAVGSAIFHPDGNNLCNRDIALVVLDQPVVSGTTPTLRVGYSAVPGDLLTVVGYGLTNPANPGSSGERHRRDNVQVVSAGVDWNQLQSAGEFSVTQSICSGDSGGPSFDATTGHLIGVHSRGADCLTASHRNTALSAHKGLIDTAFAAAGKTPSYDTSAAPTTIDKKKTGEGPCVSGYECQWSLCAGEGTEAFCTDLCDAGSSSCPLGHYCVPHPVTFDDSSGEVAVCVAIPDDACEMCRADDCLATLQTCRGDAACDALVDCADACTDDACLTQCKAANPSGQLLYDALTTCTCQEVGGCAEACGTCSITPEPTTAVATTAAGVGGGPSSSAAAGGGDTGPVADDGGCRTTGSRRARGGWWLLAIAAWAWRRRGVTPRAT